MQLILILSQLNSVCSEKRKMCFNIFYRLPTVRYTFRNFFSSFHTFRSYFATKKEKNLEDSVRQQDNFGKKSIHW
jgi:hypothetical protein